LNDLTRELVRVAGYASQVENIKRQLSARKPFADGSSVGKKLTGESVQAALDEVREHYVWTNEDFTVQALVDWIYSDDADALCEFASAAKQYASLFAVDAKLSYVEQARMYTIWACYQLWESGYDRSEVTLSMIKNVARELWRATLTRRRVGKSGHVHLPKVRWPDIFKDLGLDDLPPIRKGRPPKNRPTKTQEKGTFSWLIRKFPGQVRPGQTGEKERRS
jgi:hypothetical protein